VDLVAEKRHSFVPPARYRRPRTIWAVLGVVLTAVIFGVVSLVVSAALTPHYTVSAKVLVQPDATLSDAAPSLLSLDQNNVYLQSQVEAVQSLRTTGSAGVTVTQVGLTNVLQITADSANAKDAVATANQVLQAYLTLRRDQVNSYATTATQEIDKQLLEDSTALQGLQGSTSETEAEKSALSSDYSRLLSLKHQVTLTANTAQPTTVLHRAQLADATKTSSKSRTAVLAALVGALVAVAVIGSRRRARLGRWVASRRPVAEAGDS
jgi:hypothetical protein